MWGIFPDEYFLQFIYCPQSQSFLKGSRAFWSLVFRYFFWWFGSTIKYILIANSWNGLFLRAFLLSHYFTRCANSFYLFQNNSFCFLFRNVSSLFSRQKSWREICYGIHFRDLWHDKGSTIPRTRELPQSRFAILSSKRNFIEIEIIFHHPFHLAWKTTVLFSS